MGKAESMHPVLVESMSGDLGSGRTDERSVWHALSVLVAEIVANPDIRLSEDTLLESDLQLQSVQLVEIQVALEDLYDLELDQIEMVSCRRLRDVLDYLLHEIEFNSNRGE